MITPQKYDELNGKQRKALREAYIAEQGGACCFCGNSLADKPSETVESKPIHTELYPYGFFRWPVHLHHSHETGMTIGAVHAKCNAVLWEYFGE